MNWVKIKEKLPEEPGFYECYFPESEKYIEHHRACWFDGIYFRSGDSLRFWANTRLYGTAINKYISHWMKIYRPD